MEKISVNIDVDDLKNGLLGLVIALVEIIKDVLKLQAFKRMDSGVLNSDEIERLGNALIDLDMALEKIKREHGINNSVQEIRNSLDEIVDQLIHNSY